ncbi:hypothetical protein FA13DRAFT_1786042 [Coprinellus micaceus]|uniref:Uncharacterized protein n=1 Tax=Coprinellus micaceus TaxID=71717 RepID=A0A4Y7TVP3_COPMI|nr:hypothetical protein FA13DRAFT_1786042 [Coprinellus micaceus]
MLIAGVVKRTHADVVVDSLSRFCPSLRHAIFVTHHDLSPTPQSLLQLLKSQENLDLHVDDISPKHTPMGKDCYDRSIPEIPRWFKARSLRILSIEDGMDGEGWDGNGRMACEFWKAFPRTVFPKSEKLCLAFTPMVQQFISRQSRVIHHLKITSYNKNFSVNTEVRGSKHILETAIDTAHLTWMVDFPPGMDFGVLNTWGASPIPIAPSNASSSPIVTFVYIVVSLAVSWSNY